MNNCSNGRINSVKPCSNRPKPRVTPLSGALSIRHHQKAVARRSHTGWIWVTGCELRSFLLNVHFCNSHFPILSSTVAAAALLPELSIVLQRELT